MNEQYTVVIDTPPALVEKDTRRADEVFKRLQQLNTAVVLNDFEAADLWAEAKTQGYWQEKYDKFSEYIKSIGTDLSEREIAYRIQISLGSKLLSVSKAEQSAAKMSKLKSIFELDPTKTVTDEATQEEESMADIMRKLIVDAPSKSLKEIKEIVKRLKGEPEDPESELTWMNLPVIRGAKVTVENALELAQKLAGKTIDILTREEKDLSKAAALELVSANFLADPNNQVDEFDDEQGGFEDSVEDVDDEQEEY